MWKCSRGPRPSSPSASGARRSGAISGEVGEGVEDLQLRRSSSTGSVRTSASKRSTVARLDVEPEDERLDRRQPVEGRLVGRLDVAQRRQVDPRGRQDRRRVVGLDRFDAEQRRAGVDLHVAGHEHVTHAPADRRGDGDLHLHRLDHTEAVAGLDDVVGRDVDADDERRRRRPHDAGVVAGEAVGDAVDLDEVIACPASTTRP